MVVMDVLCGVVMLLECGEALLVVVLLVVVFVLVEVKVELFVLVGGGGSFCVGVLLLCLFFESEVGGSGELFFRVESSNF